MPLVVLNEKVLGELAIVNCNVLSAAIDSSIYDGLLCVCATNKSLVTDDVFLYMTQASSVKALFGGPGGFDSAGMEM